MMIFNSNSWTNFLVLQKIDSWNDLRPGGMISMIAYKYIYSEKIFQELKNCIMALFDGTNILNKCCLT